MSETDLIMGRNDDKLQTSIKYNDNQKKDRYNAEKALVIE